MTEEDVDRINSEVDSSSKQTEDIIEVLVKIENLLSKQNRTENSVRNLTDLNVEMHSYGTFLISIIFDRIPNEVKIIISRTFKNNVWDLRNLLDIFKQELFVARERCYAIGKDADNVIPKDLCFTGHSLLTHSQEKENSFKPNSRPGNCVYCGDKKHISSRGNVISLM